jgi:hypothetical protein
VIGSTTTPAPATTRRLTRNAARMPRPDCDSDKRQRGRQVARRAGRGVERVLGGAHAVEVSIPFLPLPGASRRHGSPERPCITLPSGRPGGRVGQSFGSPSDRPAGHRTNTPRESPGSSPITVPWDCTTASSRNSRCRTSPGTTPIHYRKCRRVRTGWLVFLQPDEYGLPRSTDTRHTAPRWPHHHQSTSAFRFRRGNRSMVDVSSRIGTLSVQVPRLRGLGADFTRFFKSCVLHPAATRSDPDLRQLRLFGWRLRGGHPQSHGPPPQTSPGRCPTASSGPPPSG